MLRNVSLMLETVSWSRSNTLFLQHRWAASFHDNKKSRGLLAQRKPPALTMLRTHIPTIAIGLLLGVCSPFARSRWILLCILLEPLLRPFFPAVIGKTVTSNRDRSSRTEVVYLIFPKLFVGPLLALILITFFYEGGQEDIVLPEFLTVERSRATVPVIYLQILAGFDLLHYQRSFSLPGLARDNTLGEIKMRECYIL